MVLKKINCSLSKMYIVNSFVSGFCVAMCVCVRACAQCAILFLLAILIGCNF